MISLYSIEREKDGSQHTLRAAGPAWGTPHRDLQASEKAGPGCFDHQGSSCQDGQRA